MGAGQGSGADGLMQAEPLSAISYSKARKFSRLFCIFHLLFYKYLQLRADVMTGVAIGMLFQINGMLLFGIPEIVSLFYFGYHLTRLFARGVHFFNQILRSALFPQLVFHRAFVRSCTNNCKPEPQPQSITCISQPKLSRPVW